MSESEPDLATCNPIDVLELLAAKAGHRLDPEWLAYWREYCAQPVESDLGE